VLPPGKNAFHFGEALQAPLIKRSRRASSRMRRIFEFLRYFLLKIS